MHTGHSHANAPAYRRRTPEKEPPYSGTGRASASSRVRASDAPSVPAAYAGKPVFNAEYDEGYVDDPSDLCNRAESEQIPVLVLPLDQDDTFRITCD